MLKLKNAVLALMMAAIAVTGFVSCSNDDDDDEPAKVTLPSTIYGNTYKGSQGVMSATLKVTDASKIYLVGGPAAMPTAINVDNQSYTVTKADDVYTVSTTNNGTAFSFTLTVTSADSVTLGYNGMSVVMSKVVDYSGYYGTYTGSMTVMGTTADMTIVVSADSVSYSSTTMAAMSGTYTNTVWTTGDSGVVLSCYADGADTSTATTKCTIVFSSTTAGTFAVTAMKAAGASAAITKSN